MAEPDATLLIEPDEPAFVRHIDSMAKAMEDRVKKTGESLKASMAAASGGHTGGGTGWQQSPMVQTTKEMEKQTKWAREILKVERERRSDREVQVVAFWWAEGIE